MTGIEHSSPAMAIFLLLIGWALWYAIRKAARNEDLYIRKIPGVDAVDEAVGRATEWGRPVSFTTALTSLSPVLYACLGVLFHIARRCARARTSLVLPQSAPEVLAVTEDVMREAYRKESRLSSFNPDALRYLSDEQFAFASGYIGIVHRENVGAAFLFGRFAGEALVLAEAGQQIGAMQVAACISPEQVPFFISTCDYTLIGEELFAASAYLTREPVQLGSLVAQDYTKFGVVLLVLTGVIIATWNSAFPGSAISNIDSLFTLPWSALTW